MPFLISTTCALVLAGIGVQLWYASRMLLMLTGLLMGIAGFASTDLSLQAGWPVPAAIAAGTALAVVAAIPIGRLLLHLDHMHLALASLALAELIRIASNDFGRFTGGATGRVVPVTVTYGEMIAFAVGALVFSAWLQWGQRGRILAALRFDTRVAAALGANVGRTRWIYLIAGAFVTGLAGGLYANFVIFISPETFGFALLVQAFAIAVIGGGERWAGVIPGVAVVSLLPYYTKIAVQWTDVVFGAIMAGILVFAPRGVLSAFDPLTRVVRRTVIPHLPLRRLGGGDSAWERARAAVAQGGSPIDVRREVPDPGAPAIAGHDINFSFGGVKAVRDVSFAVRAGEVLGILGPNGAGKTTLLNVASGMLRQSSGHIEVYGKRAKSAADLARLGVRRTFQRSQLVPDLSIFENVLTAARLVMSPADAADATRRLLHEFELEAEAAARPNLLPLGKRRLAEMARALVATPSVLLLDEVTSGADERAVKLMESAIARAAAAGAAVVLVSHDVPSVSRVVDRVILIDRGAVAAELECSELATHPIVRSVYVGGGELEADGGKLIHA